MKKDFTRDYTTEIFRAYAAAGMPTYEEARERVYKTELAKRDSMDAATAITQAEIATEKRTPYLLDIMAAEKTLGVKVVEKTLVNLYSGETVRCGDTANSRFEK